jgi:YegS C-terminal NAD kinase beta sandwich-like domain
MIRPGEEWGRPTSDLPDFEVAGSDADLAAAAASHPGALVRFRPDPTSDFAAAVGLGVERVVPSGTEVTLDLLRLDDGQNAVNMIVLGTPPDSARRFVRRFGASVRVDEHTVLLGPCTAVVIAIGQFRHGLDLVPRGHPGDGRAEVQIYAVPGRERRALRARLATGTHVPHPHIAQRTGRRIALTTDRRVPLEIDGRTAAAADVINVEVVPNAYRLLL